ncbi:MAG: BON domain-containing protein [Rhodospirillales bacterium]|nr:BON domain-containing protein [Rhodospirillales bacterium]
MGQINRVEPEDHLPEVREPAGYRHPDTDIASELRECLADDVGLDSRGIEVEVKDGEVTLSGTVRHCADMKRAEAHACAVRGVVLVRNGLQPKEPSPSPAPEQPAGAAAKMGKPGYEH